MPLYGYARVSTDDQDLTLQRAALVAAGCEVIRAETASGTRRDGRTEFPMWPPSSSSSAALTRSSALVTCESRRFAASRASIASLAR